MQLENTYPQFRDTGASTMLRNDSNSFFQFSVPKQDSLSTPANPKPQATPKAVTKKKLTVDSSYHKVLAFKKEYSKTHLSAFPASSSIDSMPHLVQKEVAAYASSFPSTEVPATKPYSEEPETGTNFARSGDWMVGILLLSLITLAWIRMRYRKILIDNRKAVISLRDAERLLSEQNALVQRVHFTINMVFYINLGMFAYQVLSYFKISIFDFGGFWEFLSLTGSLFLVYSFRSLANHMLAYLFQFELLGREVIHNIFTVNRALAYLFLPFIIAIPFVPTQMVLWLIYTGFIVFLTLYLWQVVRNMQLFLINNPSLLYSIFYLCALEIVPVVVLAKFFGSLQVT